MRYAGAVPCNNALRAAVVLAAMWAAPEGTDGQMAAGREAPLKLVQFSAVALDSHGQPVGDLTADDFRITDAGKPQKVAVFRHSDSKLQQVPPLGPGEFSNRTAANVPHATLILFDLLNEDFGARGAAADNLVRVLKSLESSDCLYLYILTADARLYPVYGLPGSGHEAPPFGGVPWTKDAKALVDGAMGKVSLLRPPTMDIDTRVRATYRSLGSVAWLLMSIPGRKNIVWITHGVPIELGPGTVAGDWPVDYTPMLRELSLTMGRGNVAIYPAMQVTPGMAAPDSEGAQYSGMGSRNTLQQFADLTGGPANPTNAIGELVRQAMNDMRTSYQIGYYAPAENWDGKFHKLRVTCTRKGVRIQAKTGYYAWLGQSSDEQDALDAAVTPAFDASKIGLRGTKAPSPQGAGHVHFTLRIEPSDVRIWQQGDRYIGHLGVQVVAYPGEGEPQRSEVNAMDLNWSAEDLANARRDGIRWSRDIKLEEWVEKVRFLVFDRESYAIGTLTLPVK